jgi:hypothetical protein
MQKLLDFFNPGFIRRIDRYLLLYYPRLWATKFHYVILYGVLANLFGAVIIFIFIRPYQIGDFNNTFIWIIILIEIAAFIFWLNTQALFSVELEYGNTHYSVGIVETIVYTICTASIFSSSVLMMLTGVYKIDSDLQLNSNSCFGPIVWEFYSSADLNSLRNGSAHYDINKLKAVFDLAQQETFLGETLTSIMVQSTAVRQKGFVSVFDNYINGSVIPMDAGKEIKIQSGEAEIRSLKDEIIIKSGGSSHRIQRGERVQIHTGDEITYEPTSDEILAPATIDLLVGDITTSTHYTKHLQEGEAIIVENNNEIQLVRGETTIEIDGAIIPYQQIYSDLYYSGSNVCQGIALFMHDRGNYSDYDLGIYTTIFWVLALTVLGILLVIILKHSNWRILIISFLYTLISTLVLIFLAAVVSSFVSLDFINWYQYGVDSSSAIIIITLAAFAVFAIIESATLIRTKRYKPFAFINFVSLPIAIGVLVTMTAILANNTDYDNYIRILSVFFLVYLVLSPIQKRLLVYMITLPRE